MVTIQDKIDEIKNGSNYVNGSLIIYSLDEQGVVYKWLENINGVAERKKLFIELDPIDANKALEERTAVSNIEVEPASG